MIMVAVVWPFANLARFRPDEGRCGLPPRPGLRPQTDSSRPPKKADLLASTLVSA